jgi:hypothetical protein
MYTKRRILFRLLELNSSEHNPKIPLSTTAKKRNYISQAYVSKSARRSTAWLLKLQPVLTPLRLCTLEIWPRASLKNICSRVSTVLDLLPGFACAVMRPLDSHWAMRMYISTELRMVLAHCPHFTTHESLACGILPVTLIGFSPLGHPLCVFQPSAPWISR